MIPPFVEALIRRMLEESGEKAFEELYYRYYERFFRIAFYYLKNDDGAQEVAVICFTKIWELKKSLLEIEDFDRYSFSLVKNEALSYLKNDNTPTVSIDDAPECIADADPEELLEREEALKLYLKTIDELPERCRQVYVMLREDKLSYKEVAEKLNISTKTVDAQLQKAVSRLREKFSEYFEV